MPYAVNRYTGPWNAATPNPVLVIGTRYRKRVLRVSGLTPVFGAGTIYASFTSGWKKSGTGQSSSTASRNRCSEPTPGLPAHEKTSLRAQPIPISWS